MASRISIIHQGTRVKGEVHSSGILIVTGVVEGDVFGKRVIIKDSGHVRGDIHAETLVIEPGGLFDGRARVAAGNGGPKSGGSGDRKGQEEPDVS